MPKSELEKLLVKAVAEALGVEIPVSVSGRPSSRRPPADTTNEDRAAA